MNFLNRLTSLLLMLTLLMVSGAINAESASGLQNLSSGLYQGTSSFNLLMYQGKSGFSYDGALGSSVVAKGTISVDDALGKAANFMKDGVPIRSIDGKTGVQFIQEFSENGQKITKRVGIDVNPNSSHVKQLGPHLNLQTQINGIIQKAGSLADPHIPIDSKTIRSGDY